MEHRVRATVDIWIARIGTVFGWFWCVLYTLAAIVGFCEMPDAKDNLDRVMPFICLALAALHYLLTRVARRVRKLVTDFRYYAALLAKDKSVSALCRQVGEPAEEVEKKLAELGDAYDITVIHEAAIVTYDGSNIATPSGWASGIAFSY